MIDQGVTLLIICSPFDYAAKALGRDLDQFIAKEFGIDRKTVSGWIKGVHKPHESTLLFVNEKLSDKGVESSLGSLLLNLSDECCLPLRNFIPPQDAMDLAPFHRTNLACMRFHVTTLNLRRYLHADNLPGAVECLCENLPGELLEGRQDDLSNIRSTKELLVYILNELAIDSMLYLMALLEREYFSTNYAGIENSGSYMVKLLPKISEGKYINPMHQWFVGLQRGLNCESIQSMARLLADTNAASEKRQLYRWRKGENYPRWDRVKSLIESVCVVQETSSSKSESLKLDYLLAYVFARLFNQLFRDSRIPVKVVGVVAGQIFNTDTEAVEYFNNSYNRWWNHHHNNAGFKK